MEENKTEEYILGAEERAIFEELKQVEASVEYNIKKLNRTLLQTRYYKEFILITKEGPVKLSNFFITVEQEENGKLSYHFRWFDKKLSMIDENMSVEKGKVHVVPEFKDIVGNIKINIEELITENDKQKGRLKGITEKLTVEQIRKIFSEEEQEEAAQAEKIELDFAKQTEKVKIGKYVQIKNNKIFERIPGVFEKGRKHIAAEDIESGNYIIIEKDKDKYYKNPEIQSGQFTIKKIFIMEHDEEKKEYQMYSQIMHIESYSNRKILIQKDELGELKVELIQVTQCQNLNEKI